MKVKRNIEGGGPTGCYWCIELFRALDFRPQLQPFGRSTNVWRRGCGESGPHCPTLCLSPGQCFVFLAGGLAQSAFSLCFYTSLVLFFPCLLQLWLPQPLLVLHCMWRNGVIGHWRCTAPCMHERILWHLLSLVQSK